MSTQQLGIDWTPPAPAPIPAAADPHCPAPARRRARTFNRELLQRLFAGPVRSEELEGWGPELVSRYPYGKRYSARLHDIRQWLREDLGYEGDPIPRRALDDQACTWEWRLTDEARRLAADALRDEALNCR